MSSVFALSIAAVLVMAGEAPRQGNFEIQDLMSAYNMKAQAVDAGMMELKRLAAQPSSADTIRQQKEHVEDLRKAVGAISDIAKKAQTAAAKEQPARRRVVEGYAAEFYSGSQALQRMVSAFPASSGPRVEELQRASDASGKLKKAAEDLRRAAAPPKQRER
jgi:hypothetical protein